MSQATHPSGSSLLNEARMRHLQAAQNFWISMAAVLTSTMASIA